MRDEKGKPGVLQEDIGYTTEARKVLVIDEDRQSGERMKFTLALHYNDEVNFAHDGHLGLEMAQQDPPDIIFVNLWVPGLNAFQFYERLKAVPTLQNVHVVFFGALDLRVAYPKMQRLGAAGYLRQPFSPDDLLDARDAVLRDDMYYSHV